MRLIFIQKLQNHPKKNFERNGDPMLLRNQFEEIKNELLDSTNVKIVDNIFIEIKDFGTICLN